MRCQRFVEIRLRMYLHRSLHFEIRSCRAHAQPETGQNTDSDYDPLPFHDDSLPPRRVFLLTPSEIPSTHWRLASLGQPPACRFVCQPLTVISFFTSFTPLMSPASLVTRSFSAWFLAMPRIVTIPSFVSTSVFKALVDRWVNSASLTAAVTDASSIFSFNVSGLGSVFVTAISLTTSFTPSTSRAYSVVRSFSAWLSAVPFTVTMPSFTDT